MRHAEQDALSGGFKKWYGPRDRTLVSTDLEEVTAILRKEVGPQTYELERRTNPFFTKIQFRQLDSLKLSYAWFSSAMRIHSVPQQPYYSLFFRRNGASDYRAGRKSFVTSPSRGALLPGLQPVEVHTQENWHVFGTQIPPNLIRHELAHLQDDGVTAPVEFDPEVDFEHGAGRIIKRSLLRPYAQAAGDKIETAGASLAIRHLERMLVTQLLEGLSHNYSKRLSAIKRKLGPWQVRIVEEFIVENADQPLSLGDLAAVCGAGARSLQYAFQLHRGCSPMEFLRQIRFERAKADLDCPASDRNVTSIAMRWGFFHLGRFAIEYRKRFGESPSETIRRMQEFPRTTEVQSEEVGTNREQIENELPKNTREIGRSTPT